jgi:hypothetical protein
VGRLFALDQNFPEPLVDAVSPFMPEVELVPIRKIDPRLADMEDWQVLLALHRSAQPWDGLVTTDSSMLKQPRELAVLRQSNLTLVVTHASGHDPIKATGLLLTHMDSICHLTTDAEPQIWELVTRKRYPSDPWTHLERVAEHQNRDVEEMWNEVRLSAQELARDPLAD